MTTPDADLLREIDRYIGIYSAKPRPMITALLRRCRAALAEKVLREPSLDIEDRRSVPVAWLWNTTHNRGLSFTRSAPPDELGVWFTPLYDAALAEQVPRDRFYAGVAWCIELLLEDGYEVAVSDLLRESGATEKILASADNADLIRAAIAASRVEKP